MGIPTTEFLQAAKMEQIETLLSALLEKMGEVADSLQEISAKLDRDPCIHDIDDVVSAIENVGDKILGPMGYNLGDIHEKLDGNDVVSAIENVGDKIAGPIGYNLGDIHDKVASIELTLQLRE